mgnify:CR=1 FL=1
MKRITYIYTWFLLIAYYGMTVFSFSRNLTILPYLVMAVLTAYAIVRLRFPISFRNPVFLLLIYELYIVAVSIYMGADFRGGIMSTIRIIMLILATNYAVQSDYSAFLKATFDFSALFFTLNTLVVLFFPNGILDDTSLRYPVYILGTRNSMGSGIITLMILNFLYAHGKNKSIRRKVWIINLVGAISSVMLWSATSMIGIILIVMFAFIDSIKWLKKIIDKISIIHIYLMGIAIFFVFQVFQLQAYFSYFIEVILKKTITMSARTMIWTKAIDLFLENKYIGYGTYNREILDVVYFAPDNAHSLFLEILLMGGLIGFIIFSAICISMAMNKVKGQFISGYHWIKCFFIILMVMGISESTILYYGLIIFVVIASYMLDIKKNRQVTICSR